MKPLSEFHRSRRYADGRDIYCRACRRALSAEYRPSARMLRSHRLWARYGVTAERFEALERAQLGECAICHEAGRRLCIDLDPSIGRVRGLLCGPCKRAVNVLFDAGFRARLRDYMAARRGVMA